MKSLSLHKFLVALVLLSVVGVLCGNARRSTWDDDANRRKAANYYIEAIEAFMDENYNLYGQLLNRAYSLDPDDPELAMRLGEWKLLTSGNDSAAVEEAFRMLFDAYDRKPADYFEGNQMLNLTSNFRRWDDNLRAARKMAEQFPQRNEVMLQLGRSYLVNAMISDTSYISKALEVFNTLEGRVGVSPQISDLKIRTHAIKNDTAAIIRELSALNDASPSDSYTALTIGQFYNSLQMPDSALRYFTKACELDSTNGSATLLRARFLQEQGDSLAFESEAMRAIKSPDLEFESKVKFIVSYINSYSDDSTRQESIDNMFETLLDVNSGEPDVYRLYAEYLMHTDKPDQAADRMSYVVSLEPNERNNWLLLAQSYASAKNFAKAADALADGGRIFPGEVMFVRAEAVYRAFSGDTLTAVRLLEEFPDSTITDPEERSEFKSLLGDYYYQTHRRDDAFGAYEEALKINPFNYMAMNNVAYYYAETDTLLDRAESYIKRVIRNQPDNPTFLDTYAWVLYKQGDYEGAREQIDRTLQLTEFENTMDSIDASLADLTDVDKPMSSDTPSDESTLAEQAIEEAESAALPGSADLYEHAGDIYFRCGEVAKAVEFWKNALDRNPADPEQIKAKIKHRKIIEK